MSQWVAVDVAEDEREAARIAAIAVRALAGPVPVPVIGSAELLRDGGQEAIHLAAVDLWATAGGGASASGR